MAVFTIQTKRGAHLVYISDKDAGRVTGFARFSDAKRVRDHRGRISPRDKDGYLLPVDYSQPLGSWHVVWKAGKIDTVATTTKYGRRTRQVKLHDYILGEIPKCKAVRHRDGDPLNNTRENLALYQAYVTEKLDSVKKSENKLTICVGCKDENICRRVATRKKFFKDESHAF